MYADAVHDAGVVSLAASKAAIDMALQWLAGQASAELPLPALALLHEVLSRPRK